jgi:hypothetical protein
MNARHAACMIAACSILLLAVAAGQVHGTPAIYGFRLSQRAYPECIFSPTRSLQSTATSLSALATPHCLMGPMARAVPLSK